jgi:hypothetical protein
MEVRSAMFLIAATLSHALEPRALPQLPRQFEALIETTAHQLERSSEQYPPRVRQYRVHYDYDARRARVDESRAAGVPARAAVKRYDLSFEFAVRELGDERSCLKSRVREAMPPAQLPDNLVWLGRETVLRLVDPLSS